MENIYGENNHHIIESCFKALARSLRNAVAINEREGMNIFYQRTTLTMIKEGQKLPSFKLKNQKDEEVKFPTQKRTR